MIKAAPKAKQNGGQTVSGKTALELARRVLGIEADAVRALIERIDERFLNALAIILERRGRVVVSGIGKSGHIARKIASTLASTGTPAVFLHPTDALHGDSGLFVPGDAALFISKSGGSEIGRAHV